MSEIFAYAGLGLIIGSFINVLAERFNTGKTLLGRSLCMFCGHTIAFYDLVPLASWIFLSGKCRYCKKSISVLYPITEFFTTFVYVLIGLAHLSPFITGVGFFISSVLIAIARYDLKYKLIPNVWAHVFILCSLAVAAYSFVLHQSIGSVLAGPAIALPFFGLWFFSKGEWMGFGDVKLALGIGWLLGSWGGTVAILFAFILGAIVGLGLILFSNVAPKLIQRLQWLKSQERFTMKSEVPFGPFLIVACLSIWITQMYGIPLFGIL